MEWKIIIQMGFMTLGVIILLTVLIPQMEGALGLNIEPCIQYVNASSSAIKYVWGKCYIPTYSHYETNEVCRGGFIGIGQSCYESSEPHYESIRGYRCVVAKTGEACTD